MSIVVFEYRGLDCLSPCDTLNTYIHLGAMMATSIRLDPAIEERLDHLASATGRTKAYYLRELVVNGLEDLEDFYLADATMERIRKGDESTFSSTEVRSDLGLDH
jgi:RHH-type rel operon transcriptional repressor/antitoxin RelB